MHMPLCVLDFWYSNNLWKFQLFRLISWTCVVCDLMQISNIVYREYTISRRRCTLFPAIYIYFFFDYYYNLN